MTFVDTSAWVALFITEDTRHAAAVDWIQHNQERLISSDYVLDETLTLLKTRFNIQAAIRVGQSLRSQRPSKLVYSTPEDVETTWKIFQSHRDKGWSFTDCSTFALMRRLHIKTIFAFDRHFSQMRGIRRVPS